MKTRYALLIVSLVLGCRVVQTFWMNRTRPTLPSRIISERQNMPAA